MTSLPHPYISPPKDTDDLPGLRNALAAIQANFEALSREKVVSAREIDVDTLSAFTADAGLITAGTFRGPIFETSETDPKVRLDETGFFATTEAGGTTFSAAAQTGIVSAKGQFLFGEGSRLLANDTLDLYRQVALGYRTPSLVQTAALATSSDGETLSFDQTTQSGDVAVLSVVGCSGSRSASAIPGWTEVATVEPGEAEGAAFISVFVRDATTSFQSVTIDFAGHPTSFSAQMIELVGVDVPVDQLGVATGIGTSASVSSTAATTQADEIAIAMFGGRPDELDVPDWSEPSGYVTANRIRYGSTVLSGVFTKNLVTTGVQDATSVVPVSTEWSAAIITLKAKAASVAPETPEPGRLRIFASDEETSIEPYIIDSNGNARGIGLTDPPFAWIHRTTDQPIANLSVVTVDFNATHIDRNYAGEGASGSPHADLVGNSLICRKSGLYKIEGRVAFEADAYGDRGLNLFRSGSIIDSTTQRSGTSSVTSVASNVTVDLVAGDVIRLAAFQTCGHSLDSLVLAGTAYPSLRMVRLGRG